MVADPGSELSTSGRITHRLASNDGFFKAFTDLLNSNQEVNRSTSGFILRLPKASSIFELSNFPILLDFWFSTSRSVDSIRVSFYHF
jgi:hypothetical protein